MSQTDWRAINPGYLAKLSEAQKKFILTGVGRKFYHEFIFRRGNHVYVIGDTGSGKTNRGHFLVNWLKNSENIIWISTGKSDEIIPLLFMGKKVNILVPGTADFSIECAGEEIDYELFNTKITRVNTPEHLLNRIEGYEYDTPTNDHPNTINILELRNTLAPKIKSLWLAEFFSLLAQNVREGTLQRKILPGAIFLDETQWIIGGTRITTNQERVKTSEIVTENALELRSEGGRLVFFAQDFKNITPAIRENMLCGCLNRNAKVEKSESQKFARWCNPFGGKPTSRFSRNEMRFVFDDGDCFPPDKPWLMPIFPIDENDRKKAEQMHVRYGKKFDGKLPESEIVDIECFPDLGRYTHLTIPPEKRDEISRWQSEGVQSDD